MKNILFFLLLFTQICFGAKAKENQIKLLLITFTDEIGYLASDKLEGRRTGTPGEKLAYEYLSDQFKKLGLIPKGR